MQSKNVELKKNSKNEIKYLKNDTKNYEINDSKNHSKNNASKKNLKSYEINDSKNIIIKKFSKNYAMKHLPNKQNLEKNGKNEHLKKSLNNLSELEMKQLTQRDFIQQRREKERLEYEKTLYPLRGRTSLSAAQNALLERTKPVIPIIPRRENYLKTKSNSSIKSYEKIDVKPLTTMNVEQSTMNYEKEETQHQQNNDACEYEILPQQKDTIDSYYEEENVSNFHMNSDEARILRVEMLSLHDQQQFLHNERQMISHNEHEIWLCKQEQKPSIHEEVRMFEQSILPIYNEQQNLSIYEQQMLQQLEHQIIPHFQQQTNLNDIDIEKHTNFCTPPNEQNCNDQYLTAREYFINSQPFEYQQMMENYVENNVTQQQQKTMPIYETITLENGVEAEEDKNENENANENETTPCETISVPFETFLSLSDQLNDQEQNESTFYNNLENLPNFFNYTKSNVEKHTTILKREQEKGSFWETQNRLYNESQAMHELQNEENHELYNKNQTNHIQSIDEKNEMNIEYVPKRREFWENFQKLPCETFVIPYELIHKMSTAEYQKLKDAVQKFRDTHDDMSKDIDAETFKHIMLDGAEDDDDDEKIEEKERVEEEILTSWEENDAQKHHNDNPYADMHQSRTNEEEIKSSYEKQKKLHNDHHALPYWERHKTPECEIENFSAKENYKKYSTKSSWNKNTINERKNSEKYSTWERHKKTERLEKQQNATMQNNDPYRSIYLEKNKRENNFSSWEKQYKSHSGQSKTNSTKKVQFLEKKNFHNERKMTPYWQNNKLLQQREIDAKKNTYTDKKSNSMNKTQNVNRQLYNEQYQNETHEEDHHDQQRIKSRENKYYRQQSISNTAKHERTQKNTQQMHKNNNATIKMNASRKSTSLFNASNESKKNQQTKHQKVQQQQQQQQQQQKIQFNTKVRKDNNRLQTSTRANKRSKSTEHNQIQQSCNENPFENQRKSKTDEVKSVKERSYRLIEIQPTDTGRGIIAKESLTTITDLQKMELTTKQETTTTTTPPSPPLPLRIYSRYGERLEKLEKEVEKYKTEVKNFCKESYSNAYEILGSPSKIAMNHYKIDDTSKNAKIITKTSNISLDEAKLTAKLNTIQHLQQKTTYKSAETLNEHFDLNVNVPTKTKSLTKQIIRNSQININNNFEMENDMQGINCNQNNQHKFDIDKKDTQNGQTSSVIFNDKCLNKINNCETIKPLTKNNNKKQLNNNQRERERERDTSIKDQQLPHPLHGEFIFGKYLNYGITSPRQEIEFCHKRQMKRNAKFA